ncbi:MAG: pyridoxal phosphate-dependent aminotransferase [Candidatus Thorarchaeota archaeon]
MVRRFEEKTRFFQKLFNNDRLAWMGQNTNHFTNYVEIKDAMKKSIDDEEYHKYTPPMGLEELRSAIADDLGVPDATTWITDGATVGLYQLTHTLLNAGDEFLTTDPGYFITINFARHAGATVVSMPVYNEEQQFKLKVEQLKDKLNPKAKMLYLVDPNNPLGCVYTESEIRAFSELCQDNGTLLVHDSTYKHFADEHFSAIKHSLENSLAIYSFSKFAGLAGLRIGAVVSNEAIIEEFTNAQVNNLGTNVVAQRGAIAALRTKGKWFGDVLKATRRNASLVKDAVDSMEGAFVTVYPSSTNFLCVDIKGTGVHPENLCSYFLENTDFFIRHAGYQTELYKDRFVKISVSIPEPQIKAFCDYFPTAIEEARNFTAKKALF